MIVVDDGSTDGSVDVIRRGFGRDPRVLLLEKENGGQLSAINAGFARVTGDLVFFLDADDLYRETWLERASERYAAQPDCGFVYCAMEECGDSDRILRDFETDRDLGYSVVATIFGQAWIGGPMSCLSIRRNVLERFLPLPLERDWRQRADDCLILGASVAMARKAFLAEPLVDYRFHGQNHSLVRRDDAYCDFSYRLTRHRLVAHLTRTMGFDAPVLAGEIVREFRACRDVRTERELGLYRRAIRRAGRDRIWTMRQIARLRRAHREMKARRFPDTAARAQEE